MNAIFHWWKSGCLKAIDICIFFMFDSGEWKELEFKKYNFSAKGFPTEGGHSHALLKARINSSLFS